MCGIRRREMKMVLVLLWAAGAIVLGIGVFELFLTGSLGEILKKEETKTMLAQVLAVFLWNLLWLSRVKNRKARFWESVWEAFCLPGVIRCLFLLLYQECGLQF